MDVFGDGNLMDMLGRKAPLLEIERKLRTLILETNNVKAIVSLTIIPDYRYRTLAIDFVVLSKFGTVEGAVINLGVG